jgi:tetratricopeptide (TPR) repeat protein
MSMSAAYVFVFALLAQAAAAAPAPEDKAKAQGLLTEGTALYEKGDYTGALEKFHAALAAFPSAKIWFNIGQANRDLGRPVAALEAFERFLEGVPDASSEDRADAQTSVAELQKRLGQLTIVCEMAGAAIRIDGKDLGPAPVVKPVWAVPGMHQVTATLKGATPALEEVEVSAGGSTTVVLKIGQPAVAAAPAVPPPVVAVPPPLEVVTTPPPSESKQGWWLGRKWTWVAAGSTVLLTGAAAGVGISVNSRFDELDNSCGASGTGQGCSPGDIDSLRTRKYIANALWGLAGAAAVTTGVLFFVEGRRVAVAPVAGETTGLVAWMGF